MVQQPCRGQSPTSYVMLSHFTVKEPLLLLLAALYDAESRSFVNNTQIILLNRSPLPSYSIRLLFFTNPIRSSFLLLPPCDVWKTAHSTTSSTMCPNPSRECAGISRLQIYRAGAGEFTYQSFAATNAGDNATGSNAFCSQSQ